MKYMANTEVALSAECSNRTVDPSSSFRVIIVLLAASLIIALLAPHVGLGGRSCKFVVVSYSCYFGVID